MPEMWCTSAVTTTYRCCRSSAFVAIVVTIASLSLLSTFSYGLRRHWNQYNTESQQSVRHHREHVREFSCGRFHYRTFYLDAERDALYVGAMDTIYRLNLNNINKTRCETDSLSLSPNNVGSCVSKGKSELYDCRNHIRVIEPIGSDSNKLYICGTNAHNPKDWVIY
ncbi:unnamed protein product, partial [Medioppia subpectinata]